ncbi:hypothetical protein HYT02_00905 [Candidatus Gottesmanbacteria bacterium]|nr:hypothetical protein [Candidatus Gottesmanbacteria bacterium]
MSKELPRRRFLKFLVGTSFLNSDTIDDFISNLEINEYFSEFQNYVLPILTNNIDKISKIPNTGKLTDLNLLRTYYPVYRVGQDRFGIPWYLLWIIHERESTMSTNINAFNMSTGYKNAMQRDPRTYTDEEAVSLANEYDYEYLKFLSLNHPSDYLEIPYAAKILRDHAIRIMGKGDADNWNEAVGLSLNNYCSQECADSRRQAFGSISDILGQNQPQSSLNLL